MKKRVRKVKGISLERATSKVELSEVGWRSEAALKEVGLDFGRLGGLKGHGRSEIIGEYLRAKYLGWEEGS